MLPAAVPFGASAGSAQCGCPAARPWSKIPFRAVNSHAICRAESLELPFAHPRRGESGGLIRSYRGKKRGYLSTLSERPWIPETYLIHAGMRVGPSGP